MPKGTGCFEGRAKATNPPTLAFLDEAFVWIALLVLYRHRENLTLTWYYVLFLYRLLWVAHGASRF